PSRRAMRYRRMALGAAAMVAATAVGFGQVRWTQRMVTGPSARQLHAMAYDSARDRVVLFGGNTTNPSTYYADTWEWDGATWVKRLPSVAPYSGYGGSMAYDSRRGRTVLFQWNRGIWEWDGTNWTGSSAVQPREREWSWIAYDSARGRIVLFGGYGSDP